MIYKYKQEEVLLFFAPHLFTFVEDHYCKPYPSEYIIIQKEWFSEIAPNELDRWLE